MVALYTLHSQDAFCCRIPSVSGKRYLKNAFGGHHTNDADYKFKYALQKFDLKGNRDTCDIDGYLYIPQGGSCYMEDRLIDAEKIKRALQFVFPRITEWKEVDFQELYDADKIN